MIPIRYVADQSPESLVDLANSGLAVALAGKPVISANMRLLERLAAYACNDTRDTVRGGLEALLAVALAGAAQDGDGYTSPPYPFLDDRPIRISANGEGWTARLDAGMDAFTFDSPGETS